MDILYVCNRAPFTNIIRTVNKTSLQKFPELDGLRGLAILMVMAYHIFNTATGHLIIHQTPFIASLSRIAKIGWAGVDIFFVLSGFLITSILLNTQNTPHYFKNFMLAVF